jgi:hypothetical protein
MRKRITGVFAAGMNGGVFGKIHDFGHSGPFLTV